jgi:DNA repair exonuclease SbcCD ATPase subunit
MYPIMGEKLLTMTPTNYLWIACASTLILWGITCAIAFENPVESFLNKILCDAKKQSTFETQTLENKSEMLDLMYETIESGNEKMSQLKDMVCNIRADVKEIEPLRESLEKTRAELVSLKREMKKIEETIPNSNLCLACGKPLLTDFRLCPYCGEPSKVKNASVIELKNYK